MLKGALRGVTRRYGIWLVVQGTMGLGIVACAALLILEAALPVRVDTAPTAAAPDEAVVSADELFGGLQTSETAAGRIAAALRPGLFKSATPVSDKPMADKTIEKIRSQLKLQCIVRIKGQPVAYVNVENRGLKKCRVGDRVEDLFTVVNINENNIEIEIIEHPITLSL
jgi:hypothetical protein